MAEFLTANFDLFSVNPQVLAVTQCYERELSPINAIDQNSTIEFISLPTSRVLTSLNEMCLNVKLRVLKDDKTRYSTKDVLQPR